MRRLITPLALALLAALAAWPLLRYGPPLQAQAITDGPNHLYRFVLLDWHLQHGDLFPRWFSDLQFGFGAPVLNFYAPLSYYLLALLNLLIPSQPAAFGWGFVLALAAAAAGAWLWAREQFSSGPAGLAAAAAYCFSPYIYFSILDRAAYPELWGLALAPWLFWLTLVYLRRPLPRVRLALAWLYAALILVHNLSAVLFTPLLALYAWLAWREQSDRRPGELGWLAAAFLQGAGLALFFVVPFLLESGAVQLGRAAGYVYSANFQPLADLLALPPVFDPHNVLQARPLGLPWPQVLLGLAGLGALALRRRQAAAPVGLTLGAVAFGLLALNFHASLPAWDLLAPAARVIQFPFRFLGPAMLLLAWLCAALLSRSRSSAPDLIAAVVFILYSLAWTYHVPFDSFPDAITSADIIRDEITHPERVGTSNLLEYVPRWVSELPAKESLLSRYAADPIPSRLADLPAGVKRLAERTGLTDASLTYDAPAAFTLVYDIFYFPGWTAAVDGAAVEIAPSQPNGLIAIQAPAGRHTLTLWLAPTGPKIAGAVATLLALLSLAVTWRLEPRRALAAPGPAISSLPAAAPLALAGLLAARLFLLDGQVETPFYRDGLAHIPNSIAVDFGGQLRLIGYDLPNGARLASGDTLAMRLFWAPAGAAPAADYHTAVQLVDGQGNRFGLSDHAEPGGLATSRWAAGQYALDEHWLLSLRGAPPGQYHIHVSVYSLDSRGLRALGLSDGGPDYDLGPVEVGPGMPESVSAPRLLESSLGAGSVTVGDRLAFTLVWAAGPRPAPGITAEARLTPAVGGASLAVSLAPAGPDFPSDRWLPGQVLRYPQSLDVPPDFPAGPATLSVRLLDPAGAALTEPADVGQVRVVVPPRSFTIPAMSKRIDYDFDGALRLLGYDTAGGQITLYWQALKPVARRLTVFVHVLDTGGGLLRGQDSPPVRAVTGWLPGEVITDPHPIAAGGRLEIGLYDSATGERFGQPFEAEP